MKKILLTILLLITLTACEKPTVETKVLLRNGNDIVYESQVWVDQGALITIDGVAYSMTRENDVDYTIFTPQSINYIYTYKEVKYGVSRVVMVIENPDFQITLAPGLDTVKVQETHIDSGLLFHNDDESQFTVITTSDVDTTKEGTYTITYQIYDIDGAILTLHRIVNIID